jgi:hypothetical protein
MRCSALSWLAAAPGCLAAMAGSTAAEAQPAPSFRASCDTLRASIRELAPKPDDYFTIEVVGTLAEVQSDGVLVYMLMCAPPDPQVLCVTYSTNDRKKGDRAILAGTYSERGPDHVMLDPCLHHAPEDDPADDAGGASQKP